MTGKCWRCGKRGHFAADCWKAAEPDMDAYWDGTAPDLTAAHAWWDQVTPLPPPAAAWGAPRAQRERAARGVL